MVQGLSQKVWLGFIAVSSQAFLSLQQISEQQGRGASASGSQCGD